ncbi:MAG: type II toxin-antitoxin system VapC family toxin [Actinomycetota bacterium]|nr:type II toxin-antitoxin system VapC family toxin [Actinomycetota bacterium]
MTELVLDASAGIEMITRTLTGTQLAALIPRRWDLNAVLSESEVESSRMRLANLRLRRAPVASLATRAWQLHPNITFPDACYVALAETLDCPLLTADHRLVAAPTLPIRTLHL